MNRNDYTRVNSQHTNMNHKLKRQPTPSSYLLRAEDTITVQPWNSSQHPSLAIIPQRLGWETG